MTSPFLGKCKRLRTDGPTPCLCCPGECVGDRPAYDGHPGWPPTRPVRFQWLRNIWNAQANARALEEHHHLLVVLADLVHIDPDTCDDDELEAAVERYAEAHVEKAIEDGFLQPLGEDVYR